MTNKNEIKKLDSEYKSLVGEAAYNNENVTVKNICKDFSNKFEAIQVCFLSDTHIGSSDFDIKGLVKTLTYAESQENAVIFLLGDGINSAIIGSKSDIYEDILSPGQQLEFYTKVVKLANGTTNIASLLRKLNNSGKIVVVHSGNHEDRITRAVGISASRVAAESAGVGEAYAPFYANTDIILRQPQASDGKFHFGVVTHHGTGIRNIDGVFRLLRNVDNADMCVIGHTHKYSMHPERLIRVNENGEQYYHTVQYLCLPASGGGTYGAGMALPDIHKQTAVWIAVTSQKNPYAGQVSATGIKQPEFVPAYAYFNPTDNLNTTIKQKRVSQASRIIDDIDRDLSDEVEAAKEDIIKLISEREELMWNGIVEKVKERKLKEPKGFDVFYKRQGRLSIDEVLTKINGAEVNNESGKTTQNNNATQNINVTQSGANGNASSTDDDNNEEERGM